jgi:YidC/Oxa1 family membrane protein insertase
MNYDTKNLILATVLSVLILMGWFIFVQPPPPPHQANQPVATGSPATPPGQVPSTDKPVTVSRDDALKATPRVPIMSDALQGSINLKGAQFDDLKLLHYHETIDPKSPAVTYLSPDGSPGALFAEEGFVAAQGTSTKLPDSSTVWRASEGAVLAPGKPVTLTWDNGEGLEFKRTIALDDDYVFSITESVRNNTQSPVHLIPYSRIQRQDLPHIAGYWVFYEGMLGVLGTGLTEVKYNDSIKATQPTREESAAGGWLGFTDKYFAAVIIPDPGQAVEATFQHLKVGERQEFQTDFVTKDPLEVLPGTSSTASSRLFVGPKVVSMINRVGEKFQIRRFDLMIDWGWFVFLTKPMFYLLEWLKNLFGSFAIAILVATVLVKAAVFPLANKSYASMSKMKKLQPEMQKLKEQYPDDRAKQQQGMMELYKREKVSPLSGCLPVLVQAPVFFSLYKVILTSIELRHAPFYGWIHDLSAPDPTSFANLFGLLPYTPPAMLAIGVWPILMGITMWIQMRLNPTPPDPVQASMFNWMPVIFTFMLGTFPVGLVIYWAWSNTLSVIQQSIIMRRHGVEVNLLGNIRDSLPFLKKTPAS